MPSLISLMVSVDVKHHVYFTLLAELFLADHNKMLIIRGAKLMYFKEENEP